MKEQNFKNHARLVAGFHGVAFLAIVILLIGAIRNFIKSSEENLYSASLLILVSIIFLLLFYYIRAFALKAQDRAIRAEEKLRYFILTGKPLSSKITTRQIIGLRFASDTEIVALVDRAEKETLSEKEIKKLIKNWKADTYRV
ncbi:DUF6526 family protein [Lutibacter sp.]|uniref:DUF6526 family protein n=1 Tax=Lutibacter sp. TaxID=1925666 RepID=UPI001A351A15|nr:DUF6526 family protein [Lutibacter sp.]MBI9042188.1 hypothetical protein [Lutibacter sp.]